jgi:hypothetical protein
MHYVVSDLHGHVEPLVGGLQEANLLDRDRSWCGGQDRLTFLGDYFDRGPDGIAVVDLIRRLQAEAGTTGGLVEAMIGNHEILALGMSRFGEKHVPGDRWVGHSFARSWTLNGGKVADQEGLSDEHIQWLCGLDAVIVAGQDLLLHSDTTDYLHWGDTAEQINDTVRQVLAGDDLEKWWQCWVGFTNRFDFAGPDGEKVATELLDRLGGEQVVHGHSIITSFTGQDLSEVRGPLSYAGGRALAIDGGIYAGGPCLVVRLDQDPATSADPPA